CVVVSFFYERGRYTSLRSFPTRRSSDLADGVFYDVFATSVLDNWSTNRIPWAWMGSGYHCVNYLLRGLPRSSAYLILGTPLDSRSEEHTSELQSRSDLVCRLLLEKKNNR